MTVLPYFARARTFFLLAISLSQEFAGRNRASKLQPGPVRAIPSPLERRIS